MRFYVPNMEETESQLEKKKAKEEKEVKDGEKSENSDEEDTPATIMNEKILKHAGIGE